MHIHSETGLGKLYHGDALELLRSLSDESVRLVVADPPYGIGKAEWDEFSDQRRYVEWCVEWIRECHRVVDERGSVYVMGFSEILGGVKWSAGELFSGCKWLVWTYRNKANLGSDWGRSHESILHFRKSRRHRFNVDAVRVPYNQHTTKYPVHPQAATSQYGQGSSKGKKHTWTPHPLAAKTRDVIEIPTLANDTAEKTVHPTQKPVALVKQLVLASSDAGDLVVDPFGGSGTTFAVCEETGRRWIGSEQSGEYCALIAGRLADLSRFRGAQSAPDAQQRRDGLRYGTRRRRQGLMP